MFSRLLALAVMAACVAGCNTTRGIGQDFNSVFAPSKNTSNQTMFGNPNPALQAARQRAPAVKGGSPK